MVHELAVEAFTKVLALTFAVLWGVKEEGYALPPFLGTEMGLGREYTQPLRLGSLGRVFVLEEEIGSPNQCGGCQDNKIQLAMKRCATCGSNKPYCHNEDVDSNLGECRNAMAYAH